MGEKNIFDITRALPANELFCDCQSKVSVDEAVFTNLCIKYGRMCALVDFMATDAYPDRKAIKAIIGMELEEKDE